MENTNKLLEGSALSFKKVRNHLAAQAMEINSALDAGRVSAEIINRYSELAKGKWGIVFVEAISVTPESLARKHGMVMSKENLEGFKRLVDEFKKIDAECLLMFQLSHAGRFAGDFSKKVKAYAHDDNEEHVLDTSELEEIRDAFIEAANLSAEAGADGVDIKACHGYLGGELLRPANIRHDKYGGSAENRSRLLCDAISEVRKIKPGLIIGTRMSFFEGIRGGCGTSSADDVIEDLDDMLKMTGLVIKAGADYINVSAGIPALTPQLTRPGSEGMFNLYHHFRYAKKVKESFPLTAVIGSAYSTAGRDSVEYAAENAAKGYVDFVGYGRQNLADPMFPVKLAQAPETIKWCRLCGGCSKLLKAQKAVFCPIYDKK